MNILATTVSDLLARFEAEAVPALRSGFFAPPKCAFTPAEEKVMALLMKGFSNETIARKRGTSPNTVASQIRSLLRKTGAASRAALIVWLRRRAHADPVSDGNDDRRERG